MLKNIFTIKLLITYIGCSIGLESRGGTTDAVAVIRVNGRVEFQAVYPKTSNFSGTGTDGRALFTKELQLEEKSCSLRESYTGVFTVSVLSLS